MRNTSPARLRVSVPWPASPHVAVRVQQTPRETPRAPNPPPPCANKQENSSGCSVRTLEPGKINSRRLVGARAALPAVAKALPGGGGGVRVSPLALSLTPGSEYPDKVFLAPSGIQERSPLLARDPDRLCPPASLHYCPALRGKKPGGICKNSCWKDPSHVGTGSGAHQRWNPQAGIACPVAVTLPV